MDKDKKNYKPKLEISQPQFELIRAFNEGNNYTQLYFLEDDTMMFHVRPRHG